MPDVARPAPPPTGKAALPAGWGFITFYAVAYTCTVLVLLTPLLLTLALKIDTLVGTDRAPAALALVTGIGALVAMIGNPLFGRMSDRTSSRLGMRRPWIVIGLLGGTAGTLVAALAPSVAVLVIGWCTAQLFFNALLAAMIAVLPDQIPAARRGVVSGALGVCIPAASVCGTLIVTVCSGNLVAMFLAPCLIGGAVILIFAARLDDRLLDAADKPEWSLGEVARTFSMRPRTSPDFVWVFTGRFLFVVAYAFLTTYLTYYLLDRMGSTDAEVPHQILLGTLAQSGLVVAASLAAGRLSDRTGRRKAFVMAAAIIFATAMFTFALAGTITGFLIGMGVSGLGLGAYLAVDLALVVDVLPDTDTTATDLGIFNIAGALPYSIAPAVAPAILASGGYGGLYTVAGSSALLAAAAILFVKHAR